MELLLFTFIQFDILLSFSCATSAVASADANLSARNLIAQSFSMNKFTVCVLEEMVGIVQIRVTNYVSLCH
jgi:hypothetical protein